ncbi:hypothetical protein EJ08DRAFT_700833 [Tothia fuscella]|uniref:Uncharacterized protein n=1 Tax=Tothia fuscella TaxID=1048955 RepID=A0A9P4TVG5_9PEZI|nr:hypothetical protein EJ08DRAFT_700833 [Tothia fuscella]
MASESFRNYLFKDDEYPLGKISRDNVYQFSRDCLEAPKIKDLFSGWADSLNTPYRGVTADGNKLEDLYQLQDQNAPTEKAATAANKALDALSPDEKLRAVHDLDSEDWRKWTNTEIILFDVALRLEELEQTKIDLIWSLVEASLSPEGYIKVRNVTKMNQFLGNLANSSVILNENSYGFMIFGVPSTKQPWGFSLSGHHLSLNVFFIEKQMTIGPIFVGSEPNIIDEGPHKGVQLFQSETSSALHLLESLSPEQLAQVREDVPYHQPDSPEWNVVDQRHRAGACRDNVVIPYQGLVATSLSVEQQDLLLSVVEAFQLLPQKPLQHYPQLVRKYLHETYITYKGSHGHNDPFYLRLQSPVVLIEIDHHTGIYVSNNSDRQKKRLLAGLGCPNQRLQGAARTGESSQPNSNQYWKKIGHAIDRICSLQRCLWFLHQSVLECQAGTAKPPRAILDLFGMKDFKDPSYYTPAKLPVETPDQAFVDQVYKQVPPPLDALPPFSPTGLDTSTPRNAWFVANMKKGTLLKNAVQDGNFDRIDPVQLFSSSFPPTYFLHGTADTAVPVELARKAH